MIDFFKLKKQGSSAIDKNALIADTRYTVIDTELTGLSEKQDSIISIGAVKMVGMRIELGNTFHQLVKPEAKFKPDSVVVHGITPSDVLEKPDIDEILAGFLQFCGDDIIVGHCVSIDMSFINKEMKRISGDTMQNPVVDTFCVYEWLGKRVSAHHCFSSSPKNLSLYEMAKCFGIAVRGAHDALMDAFMTAQLFQRFVPLIIDAGMTHLGDLLELGSPSKGGDRFKRSGEISNF